MFWKKYTLVVAQFSDAVVTLLETPSVQQHKQVHLLLVPVHVNVNSLLCCVWIYSWCLELLCARGSHKHPKIWLLFCTNITSNEQTKWHCFSTYCSFTEESRRGKKPPGASIPAPGTEGQHSKNLGAENSAGENLITCIR